MKEKLILSSSQARRLVLHSQLLDGRTKRGCGKSGVLDVIERLGYIQIDTIAVIQRAHHHTLWSRLPDYNPRSLHRLQAADRTVFEYWGHQASYLPMKDYRYYLPVMKGFNDPKSKWAKARLKRCGHLMQPVLKRIRAEGPLGAKDFESGDRKSSSWWDWKPAKVALELLFWQGKLMITERSKFARIYDLTERVLPDDTDISYPSDNELGEYLVKRTLSAYGLAAENEIRLHLQDYQKSNRSIIQNTIKRLLADGTIVEIKINNNNSPVYYGLTETIEKTSRLRKRKADVHILSPFDNLTIQRDRTLKLFGFNYALECYMPAPRRKYGYFVLPILYGEKFVGRMDPKADRKNKALLIRNLIFEPDFEITGEFLKKLTEKLIDFARFNECDRVKIEKADQAKTKNDMNRRLKKILD